MSMKMGDEIQHILQNAMKLSSTARAFIAEELLSSLDQETEPAISDEWKAEIARRCDQIDRGDVELIPEEQVFKDAREALG